MNNAIIELPIRLKLDEKYFQPNSTNEQALITISASNDIKSSIYTLPSTNSNGILVNDGVGGLEWKQILILPTTNAKGTEGLIKIDKCNFSSITATSNTFIGINAGKFDITGKNNLCIGALGGSLLTTGSYNTTIGQEAGRSLAIGLHNTFVGWKSGFFTIGTATGGLQNTFVGASSGYSNTTGLTNEFIGCYAGNDNTTGSENVALGTKALKANTTGSGNIAIGTAALNTIAYSECNIAIGQYAAQNVDGYDNIYIGRTDGISAYITSDRSIILGANKLTTTNHSIMDSIFIGHNIQVADIAISNRVSIGNNSTCSVDNGFILGGADTFVGIRNNSPMYPLDVGGTVKVGGSLILLPQAAPTTAAVGTIYYDTTASALKVCTATGPPLIWKTLAFAV